MLNTLIILLIFCLCASFICVAVNNVFGRQDMLLAGVGEWADLHLPIWLCKMLFACLPCMASFWGTALWFGAACILPGWPFSFLLTICLLPAIVLMLSGFNILADAFLASCFWHIDNEG